MADWPANPHEAPAQMPAIVLARRKPFFIGAVEVRPKSRELIGPGGREVIEPRVMQVLIALHDAGSEVLSRDDLIQCCWEGRLVTEDAINGAVAKLRRLGETVGAGSFRVETIIKIGYRMLADQIGKNAPAAQALAEPAVSPPSGPAPSTGPVDPTPGHGTSRRVLIGGVGAIALVGAGAGAWLWTKGPAAAPADALEEIARGQDAMYGANPSFFRAVAAFQRATDAAPDLAEAWGWLALALEGTRYFQPPHAADMIVMRRQAAIDRALALDPRNPPALTAKAIAVPEFGDWLVREAALREVLAIEPRQISARIHLSRLLEDVGRTGAAIEMVETYPELFDRSWAHFRQAILLWSAGRGPGSEQVIDRAMQRWPTDFDVWFARVYLYMRGGRPQQALDMLARVPRPPDIPAANFEFAAIQARAMLTRAPTDIQRALAEGRRLAGTGAGYCEYAISLAAQLGLNDEAFYLAGAYYFVGRGFDVPVTRFGIENHMVTPRNRRRCGFLFTPSAAPMRADPRFAALMEETGHASYWRRSGTRADVLA